MGEDGVEGGQGEGTNMKRTKWRSFRRPTHWLIPTAEKRKEGMYRLQRGRLQVQHTSVTTHTGTVSSGR